ncbi:glycoside hydrolase family 38 C-terminal domain-containing protein [Entomospira culicis]|uniref:Alpha-mannosidase n=1 Tax=Entomospira culicis TaxID=2719989 RepID=A0A968KUB4_9SPIO|nr:glycoside hydrolase family 38 C-terminal domain-containing protein [Entomospira culicis]NIZ19165.1 alpha-mannosidase [Entomospira culicis]NIZ69379.1 alpha-mannosidase [Entomospira culicis]WDI36496.1 glycoside hydrolase family 38 C-terminal domain-containing protein [Entomospira culicis]WDI38122.1 glycoside hydrolase family 38 C-terminal domain-containing protein [Entomospira culicis]
MKRPVHVVAHSHWDREWYFTLEDSNLILYRNLPYLLDLLESDPKFSSYTFDGQSSVIEEFLYLYPQERSRIEALVKAKRLFIGPWYTQCDTLLVHTESLIRNLLHGKRIANHLGHSMNIGYLPDVFGQHAYLPAIFLEMEIDWAILQRGIRTADLAKNLHFYWQSPDAQRIPTNNLFLGYGAGKFLQSTPSYYQETLRPMLQKLQEMNQDTPALLLPAGGDQVLARAHFPQTIEKLNSMQEEYTFILSDYETFMQESWRNNPITNIIHGELTASQRSRIHTTIKSQRYDIKYKSYQVEQLLLHQLEPLGVIASTIQIDYPKTLIDQIWRKLFDAQSHDSLGGCNSDETNDQIIHRLDQAKRLCDGAINLLKKEISHAISPPNQQMFLLFFTHASASAQHHKLTLFSEHRHIHIKDLQQHPLSFETIQVKEISGGSKIVSTAQGDQQVHLPPYYRHTLLLKLDYPSQIGYTSYLIEQNTQPRATPLANNSKPIIENTYYRIELQNHSLSLFDKKNHQHLSNFIHFQDEEDTGDSYDFAPANSPKSTLSQDYHYQQSIHLKEMQSLTLCHTIQTFDNQSIQASTTLTLYADNPLLEITHTIDNTASNHRLRAIIHSNLTATASYSDQGFSFLERPLTQIDQENWQALGYVEAPQAIYGLENMLYVQQEKNMCSIFTQGIKEYSLLEDKQSIALTLFRSVGLLGKDDLSIRPGRASGINNTVVYTPHAQLHQRMEFHYAVSWQHHSIRDLYTNLHRYRQPLTSYQIQTLNSLKERIDRFEIPLKESNQPNKRTLLTLHNNAIIMNLCKPSEENPQDIVIRLFNPTAQTQITSIDHSLGKIYLCNLLEKELREIEQIEISPFSFCTIKIIPKESHHD